MDAPPIPRLVDLVHAFNGVVVEQFRKRVEKLLSDSIPLWRLLKLLFKILHYCSPFRRVNALFLFLRLPANRNKTTAAMKSLIVPLSMLWRFLAFELKERSNWSAKFLMLQFGQTVFYFFYFWINFVSFYLNAYISKPIWPADAKLRGNVRQVFQKTSCTFLLASFGAKHDKLFFVLLLAFFWPGATGWKLRKE